MIKVNGISYGWTDVDVKIPGLNLVLQEISYDDEQEKEESYGYGYKPRGYGKGKDGLQHIAVVVVNDASLPAVVMKTKLCKSSFRIFDRKELTTAS